MRNVAVAVLLMAWGSLFQASNAQAQSAATDYKLHAGDKIQVSVWKEEDLQRLVIVRPDGKFSFPLTGEVQAAGRSADDPAAQPQDPASQPGVRDPEELSGQGPEGLTRGHGPARLRRERAASGHRADPGSRKCHSLDIQAAQTPEPGVAGAESQGQCPLALGGRQDVGGNPLADALRKAQAGLTTADEVIRATVGDVD